MEIEAEAKRRMEHAAKTIEQSMEKAKTAPHKRDVEALLNLNSFVHSRYVVEINTNYSHVTVRLAFKDDWETFRFDYPKDAKEAMSVKVNFNLFLIKHRLFKKKGFFSFLRD